MRMGTLAFLFMTTFHLPLLPEAKGVSEKDLGTGLSPLFMLDTLQGVAPESPPGGIGCGISASFSLNSLRGATGTIASATSDYFTLDTRHSALDVTPTPTPTENTPPTPTPTELITKVHDWESY
jgi:hypothetical protein